MQIQTQCTLPNRWVYTDGPVIPTGDFGWMGDEGVEKFDLSEWSDYGERGCILKIDARMPVDLHERMKSYPLAPERMSVKEEKLSETQKGILDQLKCE